MEFQIPERKYLSKFQNTLEANANCHRVGKQSAMEMWIGNVCIYFELTFSPYMYGSVFSRIDLFGFKPVAMDPEDKYLNGKWKILSGN